MLLYNNNNSSFNKNNGYENGYKDDSDRNRSREGDRRERLLNKVCIHFKSYFYFKLTLLNVYLV